MTTWQGAIVLFKDEMKQTWQRGLILTVFMVVCSAVLIKEPIIDAVYFSVLVSLGNLSLRHYMFSRRLAHWRTLPIGNSSIVIARMMQLLIGLIVAGIIFFAFQYLFVSELRSQLHVIQYLAFSFFWIGTAFLIGSLRLYYFERFNFIGDTVYWVLITVFFILEYLTHAGIVKSSIHFVQQGHHLLAVLMPILGIISLSIMGLLFHKRLESRSLLD